MLRELLLGLSAWRPETIILCAVKPQKLPRPLTPPLLVQTYLDKVVSTTDPPACEEEEPSLLVRGPVDRIYKDAGEYVELHVGTGAAVALSTHGWRDTVVWNPWTSVPDFYRRFVCVESAVAAVPIRLDPGSGWRGRLDIFVRDLAR